MTNVWNRALGVPYQVPSGVYVGSIMRIVLTTVLAMVATLALADEPSAPNAKSEAAAEAAADQPAAQANSTEATAKAAVEDDKPFKPPTGYRAKRVNGNQVYCTKVVVLGSRFAKEDCRTESQLRDLERQKEAMRGEMDQRNHVCSGAGACGAQ